MKRTLLFRGMEKVENLSYLFTLLPFATGNNEQYGNAGI